MSLKDLSYIKTKAQISRILIPLLKRLSVSLVAVTLALIMAVTCSSSASAAPLDLTGYKLTFNENFKSLDISAYGPGTTWTAHTAWNGDFGDAAFANPGPHTPFSLTSTGLRITASQDANGKWHSGLICSVNHDGPSQQGFAQKYGYFEISAKLPDGPGVWPAFWLIGKDKSQGTSEIDVFEYYGVRNNKLHITEHYWVHGKDTSHAWHVETVPPESLSQAFNTYGVLITPATTTFYLNRQPIYATPTPPEYQQPMYILANLALGGGWPIKRLKSPQFMDIKYIHVYQIP
jgi:beta-glucanase (GH16 family)